MNVIGPGSHGIFGQVVEWADVASQFAAARGSAVLLPEHFSETRTVQQTQTVKKELDFGEQFVTPQMQIAPSMKTPKSKKESSASSTEDQKRPKKSGQRPFVRKPGRDQVGVKTEVAE